MRSPEQLLKAWETASKETPLVLVAGEGENFSKAMKISNYKEDARIGQKSGKVTIQDRDKLLANGILSPLDGKTAFHNRRDWADHLKRNNCVEYGNDMNNHKAPTEVRGDFDCRKELSEATYQVMEKHGH